MALRYTVGPYCLLRAGLLTGTPMARRLVPASPAASSLFSGASAVHRWARLCRTSIMGDVCGIHLSLSDFLHSAYTLHPGL